MGKHYSPQNVLRKTPNSLLEIFFNKHRCEVDVDWSNLDEKDIEPFMDALGELTPDKRDKLESELRDVFDLSRENGIRALIEAGFLAGEDLTPDLAKLDGPYHKSMWVYLNHSSVFNQASLLFQANSLSQRYWRKRYDLPRIEPVIDRDAKQRLADDLSAFYSHTQGRGQRCTVDYLLRHGTDHCFFTYLDDYVDTVVEHDDDGRLIPRSQRSAFENVFIYNAGDGTLSMYAKGNKTVRGQLQDIFAAAILGQALGPEAPHKRTYRLSHLKNRSFKLATDPEDHITARIVAMRIVLRGKAKRRMTLEADKDFGPEDIYNMVDQWLNQANLPLDDLHVTQVKFQFRFTQATGRSGKSMTFTVSLPNSCDLKSKREDRQLIGEKYLKRWGIDHD